MGLQHVPVGEELIFLQFHCLFRQEHNSEKLKN